LSWRAGGSVREPAFVRDQGRIRRGGERTVAKGEFILGGDMEEVHLVARGILIGQGWSTCLCFHLPFPGGVRGMHTPHSVRCGCRSLAVLHIVQFF